MKKSVFKILKLNKFWNKRLYVDQTRGNFPKIRELLNTIEILEYNYHYNIRCRVAYIPDDDAKNIVSVVKDE